MKNGSVSSIRRCGAHAELTANFARSVTRLEVSLQFRGGGRIEAIYQPYIDGLKEISEINEEYRAPFVRG